MRLAVQMLASKKLNGAVIRIHTKPARYNIHFYLSNITNIYRISSHSIFSAGSADDF